MPKSNSPIADAEPLMTPSEVAQAFRVDPKTVTRWAKQGKLPFIWTLGGHRRYPEREIRELMQRGRPAADAAPAAPLPRRTVTVEAATLEHSRMDADIVLDYPVLALREDGTLIGTAAVRDDIDEAAAVYARAHRATVVEEVEAR
ncbi:Helix-turn-helix domain protein [Streptomonospora litoralis]|uniref:Helix-turn-helix domain protein n=1 Tax=Streptomonospora litoralis TaxID=2498135 RepID=A0A4P6PZB5_9ACTN|nr:Helix-turn-helix domain protein [Streptomonospora litoralis]